jgi:hypothetical protein
MPHDPQHDRYYRGMVEARKKLVTPLVISTRRRLLGLQQIITNFTSGAGRHRLISRHDLGLPVRLRAVLPRRRPDDSIYRRRMRKRSSSA